ncbi:MAG: NfeD family protein [Verrucomicrobiota bacterium]
MNALLRGVLSMAMVFCALGGGIASAPAAEVFVVPLKGQVSQAQFFFLRRALKEAERNQAQAVILDMDTYGGELKACVEMQKALSQVKMRTLTYINPNAGSAGALIAISTKEIYMAPISAIGAAAPVMAGGQDLPKTLEDKNISYYSNYFASVAKENGHDPQIARAFIDKEQAVVIGGQTIHEKGSVLTLSAQEAAKLVDGKPLLAAGIAPSIPEVLKQAHLDGLVREVQPTGFEVLAFWVTTLSPLFLLGGILGAYLEMKIPGFGVAGILSILCFAVFFLGHYVAGLAGWEAPVLFLIGLALVLGELLVHPGTILPGLFGALIMGLSLVWAMVDRYPGGPLVPEAGLLVVPLIRLAVGVGLAGVAIAFLAKYLPKTSFFHGLVLTNRNPAGAALSPTKSEFTRLPVGAEGVARSILRPSGRAEFGGELHDVITMGQFVDPGTRVRVVAVEGARIVVEPF